MRFSKMFFVYLAILSFYGVRLLQYRTTAHTHIHLKVEELAGEKAYLVNMQDKNAVTVDSTQVDREGNIHFKRDRRLPVGNYLARIGDRFSLPVILDEDQVFYMETTVKNAVENMQIKGSKENEAYYQQLRNEPDQLIFSRLENP